MEIVGPKFSKDKSNCQESIKHLQNLRGKLEANCLHVCLPDTDKKIFCVSLLKTILLFLTSQVILLMGYCQLFFL